MCVCVCVCLCMYLRQYCLRIIYYIVFDRTAAEADVARQYLHRYINLYKKKKERITGIITYVVSKKAYKNKGYP